MQATQGQQDSQLVLFNTIGFNDSPSPPAIAQLGFLRRRKSLTIFLHHLHTLHVSVQDEMLRRPVEVAPKAAVQIGRNWVELGSAFGQERSFDHATSNVQFSQVRALVTVASCAPFDSFKQPVLWSWIEQLTRGKSQ